MILEALKEGKCYNRRNPGTVPSKGKNAKQILCRHRMNLHREPRAFWERMKGVGERTL
jgi:hypothetical protein